MKLITVLFALIVSSTVQAYQNEPTKEETKKFLNALKIMYTDMPAVMIGLELVVDNDFNIKNMKEKLELCNSIHAMERITYFANNTQLHPKFQKNIDELKTSFKVEDIKFIRKELKESGYSCM
ncbi:hypothetical protein [Acinetobacter variabilis]|uniref:hypothetical protein n=1 Tax=Acinetobacter variabilis TaxID=70346 RepID=UPI00403DAA0C